MTKTTTPFLGSEALAAGTFSKRTLVSQNSRIYRNVYVPNGHVLTPTSRAVAAWLWSGRRAIVAGSSAAALLGTKWIDAGEPAELCRAEASVNGIMVHRDTISSGETCSVNGMAVTTPARTAYDLGRRLSGTAAVIRLDALANATGLRVDEVLTVASHHPRARGMATLRSTLEHVDGGAESPQETRTRLLLIGAGFRRPQTQIVVRDDFGVPFARLDMGWEDCLVGVEYDGVQHWTDPSRRTRDIDKYAELHARKWRIVRVNNDLLSHRQGVVVRRAYESLQAAGCTWLDECGVDLRQPHWDVA